MVDTYNTFEYESLIIPALKYVSYRELLLLHLASCAVVFFFFSSQGNEW